MFESLICDVKNSEHTFIGTVTLKYSSQDLNWLKLNSIQHMCFVSYNICSAKLHNEYIEDIYHSK